MGGCKNRCATPLPALTAAPPEHAAADAPVLYFGRLSPEKGLTDLLQAMQRLPNVQLRIAARDPKGRNWKKWWIRLGLANVEFTGQLAGGELNEAIAGARFTVFAYQGLRDVRKKHP